MKKIGILYFWAAPSFILLEMLNDFLIYVWLTSRSDLLSFQIMWAARFITFERFLMAMLVFSFAQVGIKIFKDNGQSDDVILHRTGLPRALLIALVFGDPFWRAQFSIDERLAQAVGIPHIAWILFSVTCLTATEFLFALWREGLKPYWLSKIENKL